MEKQEFDQLAQLLFSADFDSVKTALITLQGVLNDDDIVSAMSILYNDAADYHQGLYRAIFQADDVIFSITFGNENQHINICINFKRYQHKSRLLAILRDVHNLSDFRRIGLALAVSNFDFFAFAGITYCQKGECIIHTKWLLHGFPSDLSDLDFCLQYSKIHPSYESMIARCMPKETIYNVFNNCIVSNSTKAELIKQE